MLSFRSSSLPVYEACTRAFGANYIAAKGLAEAMGFKLKPRRQNVGAAIGSATHKGGAYLMLELKRTGEHGGKERTRHAQDCALDEIEKINHLEGPLNTDPTTKTYRDAKITTSHLVNRLHKDVKPTSEPLKIEDGFKADFIEPTQRIDFESTGTVDLFLIEKALQDTKTGVHKPKAYAQMGDYSLLIRSNGYDLDKITLAYLKRVRVGGMQPKVQTIYINQAVAEHHALSVMHSAALSMTALLKTGNPEVLTANPQYHLCGRKYCIAYDTNFCRVGYLTNPE